MNAEARAYARYAAATPLTTLREGAEAVASLLTLAAMVAAGTVAVAAIETYWKMRGRG